MKPDWGSFCDYVLATISQYREWTQKGSQAENIRVFNEDVENRSQLFNQLSAIRTTLYHLYSGNPHVDKLIGYILFASESNLGNEKFIESIREECRILKQENLH